MPDLRVVDLDDPDLRERITGVLDVWDRYSVEPASDCADAILAIACDTPLVVAGATQDRPEPAAPTPGDPRAVTGPQNAAGAFTGLELLLRRP